MLTTRGSDTTQGDSRQEAGARLGQVLVTGQDRRDIPPSQKSKRPEQHCLSSSGKLFNLVPALEHQVAQGGEHGRDSLCGHLDTGLPSGVTSARARLL